MIGNSPDMFIKKAVEIYNEDKLPALKITNELGDKMMSEMFKQLRFALDHPYAYKINLTKFTTFTVRHRQAKGMIEDHVQRIRWYQERQKRIEESPLGPNEKCPFTKGRQRPGEERTMQEEYIHTEKLIQFYIAEIKRWWSIRQMFMKVYTKTKRYERLQKVKKERRERADKEGIDLKYAFYRKEDMINKRLTYLEKRHKVWSAQDEE